MLRLAQPHYVKQHSIVSSSITSLQGIYDVVTLQIHILCQDLQALHLKCFLCQSNKLMCSHFKANPIPGLKYVTLAEITLNINIFSVNIISSSGATETFHMIAPALVNTVSLCYIFTDHSCMLTYVQKKC